MSHESPLILRAAQGDRDALVLLLKQFAPAARKAVAGRIPARWQALLSEDDVLQQTYADASRSIREFTSPEDRAFGAFLAQTARRNLLDALKLLRAEKRGGNRRPVEFRTKDESYASLSQIIVGHITSPSLNFAREEAKTALQQAMKRLPKDYARVVELYDLEGRSMDDVAARLKRTPGAAFMLRARAHQRLAELMGPASQYLTKRP